MKMIRNIIPLIIILSLFITSVCYAEDNNNSQSNNISKNNSFQIIQDLSNNYGLNDINQITFQKKFAQNLDSTAIKPKIILNLLSDESIKVDDYINFSGDGYITVDSNDITFSTHGSLYPIIDENNEMVLLGILTGYINNSKDNEDMISLSIHYMPNLEKAFISTCIGVDDGKGNVPLILDFGSPFTEIKNATLKKEKQIKHKEETQNLSNKELELTNSRSNLSYGGTPTEYDPRLKNTGYSTNSIMSVSVYFQNKARFQTPNEISAKVSANKANFENFMRNTYGYNIVSNSSDASTVKLEIVSSDMYYESTDSSTSVVPTASTTNLNFSIPVYIGQYNLGWQTIPINITTSSTSVSFRAATGADSSRKNITTWNFYRLAGFASTNFFTTSSTPAVASGGLAGKSKYYYVMGVSSDKAITVGAIGTSVLSCVQDSTTYITRTYNVSATAASNITITTN